MYVCGQKRILNIIYNAVDNDRFPRFSIIVAPRGFGKRVISDYIARKLHANFVPCETTVESVRDVIVDSYTVSDKTVYMFADADDMSVIAKNALLKVTEEPPNSAYFVLTVCDISNVLGTLISRGMVMYLDPYTVQELEDFADHKNYTFTEDDHKIVNQICTCPQDVISAAETEISDVYNLAESFVKYIGKANLANELKITTKLKLKESTDGIDPTMFLRCIILSCANRVIKNGETEYDAVIKTVSKSIHSLSTKGCNKQSIIDNCIINSHLLVTGGEL